MAGRNWFIPALASRGSLGCNGMRPMEGYALWPRSTKNSVNARRNSWAFMTDPIYRRADACRTGLIGRSEVAGGGVAVGLELPAHLPLILAHGLATVGDR